MRSSSPPQNDRSPESLLQEAENVWEREPSRAIELAERVETLLDGSPEEALLLRSLIIQGQSWYRLGSWSEARESFDAALHWARHLDDGLSAGTSLYFLGLVALRQSEIPSALEWLFQAKERQSASGDRPGEAHTLCTIGSAYGAAGRYREAGEVLAEALALARELGNRRIELGALGSAATLLASSGDLVQARARYEEALALAQSQDFQTFLPQAHYALCNVLAELGETEKALWHGFEAVRFADEQGAIRSRVGARKALGTVYRKRGQLDEADRWLHDALAVAEGEPLLEIWTACFHELGLIARLRGDAFLTKQYFEAALQQAIDEGNVADQAEERRVLADFYESEGDLPTTIRHLRALIQAEDVVRRQSARSEFMAAMARLEWEKSQAES